MKRAKIYTDGSFINGRAGYGAVILLDDTVKKKISGCIEDPQVLKHRQVAGEVKAVEASLIWCAENGITDAEIHYDYLGVQYWPDGTWKAKTEMTKAYSDFIRKQVINLGWVKVKAHSGDKYNEQADLLAKQGCGKYNEETSLKTDSISFKTPSELENEAVHAATDIMTSLIEDSIYCNYSGFMNNMFARIEIMDEAKRCGIIDLYNTKKKRLKIDLRGFKNSELLDRVKTIAESIINEYSL
jgi:ribonuclease HI